MGGEVWGAELMSSSPQVKLQRARMHIREGLRTVNQWDPQLDALNASMDHVLLALQYIIESAEQMAEEIKT